MNQFTVPLFTIFLIFCGILMVDGFDANDSNTMGPAYLTLAKALKPFAKRTMLNKRVDERYQEKLDKSEMTTIEKFVEETQFLLNEIVGSIQNISQHRVTVETAILAFCNSVNSIQGWKDEYKKDKLPLREEVINIHNSVSGVDFPC